MLRIVVIWDAWINLGMTDVRRRCKYLSAVKLPSNYVSICLPKHKFRLSYLSHCWIKADRAQARRNLFDRSIQGPFLLAFVRCNLTRKVSVFSCFELNQVFVPIVWRLSFRLQTKNKIHCRTLMKMILSVELTAISSLSKSALFHLSIG